MRRLVAGVGFGVLLIAGIGSVSAPGSPGLAQANAGGNVQGLAALIFTQYLWAFELTGALLITAALGAMVLAHRERFERRKTQRELAAGALPRAGIPPHCPVPVSTPGTTPSTCLPGLPDGSDVASCPSARLLQCDRSSRESADETRTGASR